MEHIANLNAFKQEDKKENGNNEQNVQKEQVVEKNESKNETTNLNTKQVEEVRYKKIDSPEGYLTNATDIADYKASQKIDLTMNLMLGDYDEVGNYVMSEKLLKALVHTYKHSIRVFNDVIYLETYKAYPEKGKLQFSLSFVRMPNGNQRAVLKFLEPINKMNGYVTNTHSFVVATFTDVNNDNFINKVYEVFNIYVSDNDEDKGKDDPEVVRAIIERLKMRYLAKGTLISNLAEIEEAYYLSRLELLRDPRFESILEEFERLKKQGYLFLNQDDPLYFLNLNQMLDLALENTKYTNVELYSVVRENLHEVTQNHANQVEILSKQADQTMEQQKEKQEEKAKETSEKKASPYVSLYGGKEKGKKNNGNKVIKPLSPGNSKNKGGKNDASGGVNKPSGKPESTGSPQEEITSNEEEQNNDSRFDKKITPSEVAGIPPKFENVAGIPQVECVDNLGAKPAALENNNEGEGKEMGE